MITYLPSRVVLKSQMKSLLIKVSIQSPKVQLNPKKGILLISGRSLPEDSKTFYGPILQWIKEYYGGDGEVLKFSLDLKYFNSSTAIQLLRLLTILEDRQAQKKDVLVDWMYDKNDTISLMKGEELADMVDVPFSFTELDK